MKICMVTSVFPPADLGGLAEVVYNLQANLNNIGEEVLVLTRCNKKFYNKPYNNEESIIRIPTSKELFIPNSFLHFNDFKLNLDDFDIIHFNDASGLGILPYIKDNLKILTFHTSPLREMRAICALRLGGKTIARPKLNEYISRFIKMPIQNLGCIAISKASDKIICVSESTKKQCLVDYELPEKKAVVIRNGVDINKFSPNIDGIQIREKYAIGNSPLLLYVGRLRILKGIHYLLYAMADIIKKYPNAKLLVIGGGAGEKDMHILTNKLGIGNNVLFGGRFSNEQLPEFYAAADIVIVPSTHEGFPLVVLEAMASGKPVVASNISGIPEAIKHGENGLLFEVGDVNQLAKHILTLLENPDLREEMGKKGRRIAEERFDWKIIARQYKNEYTKLLG